MLGRRAWANTKAEWPLAKPRLWVIIPCLIFQYIHAIFTGMACECAWPSVGRCWALLGAAGCSREAAVPARQHAGGCSGG